MSRAPARNPIEPRPSRALALPRIERRELDLLELFARHPLPIGLRSVVVHAANDGLERLVEASARPALTLEGRRETLHIACDELELPHDPDRVAALGFEVRRSRAGFRIVATGDFRVTRNGWRLARGRAERVAHGDVITGCDGAYVARIDPEPPRPTIEIGPARLSAGPPPDHVRYAFVLEPCGQPIVLSCDRATERAVLDAVACGDGSRPFDPTVMTDVDRALVEWTVRNIAHEIVSATAGDTLSLRESDANAALPDVWLAAAVRIGAYHGVWWFGTTTGAISSVAFALDAERRAQQRANPALSAIRATLVARIPVGRLTLEEVAGLESGDLLIARGVRWSSQEPVSVSGTIGVAGAGGSSVPATVELCNGRVRAQLAALAVQPRRHFMNNDVVDGIDSSRVFESALDELGVVVCVEMGRKRLSLSEILALSPGDVVELQSAVRNSVVLTIDGSPLARGELVDADGALGVRVLATGGRR